MVEQSSPNVTIRLVRRFKPRLFMVKYEVDVRCQECGIALRAPVSLGRNSRTRMIGARMMLKCGHVNTVDIIHPPGYQGIKQGPVDIDA